MAFTCGRTGLLASGCLHPWRVISLSFKLDYPDGYQATKIIFEVTPGGDGHQDNEEEQESARPTRSHHLQFHLLLLPIQDANTLLIRLLLTNLFVSWPAMLTQPVQK